MNLLPLYSLARRLFSEREGSTDSLTNPHCCSLAAEIRHLLLMDCFGGDRKRVDVEQYLTIIVLAPLFGAWTQPLTV